MIKVLVCALLPTKNCQAAILVPAVYTESVTICIEEATGIDDPDLIYVGGNYYYPQETTVTVRADGIWNPTTNQYQVNNYLSYTVTPVIDGISQPSLAQTHLDGETQFEAATNTPVGITHDFTFGTVSSYSFTIEYQNPIGEAIYQDLTGLGPTCVRQLPTIDVENTCVLYLQVVPILMLQTLTRMQRLTMGHVNTKTAS